MTKFPPEITFFIIAGAGKSGSTALANVMQGDVDIAFSKIKETRFFLHQVGFRRGGSKLGPSGSGNWLKGESYYANLFDFSTNPSAFGEASMSYFFCHEAPELIFSFRPDTRLIFLLRDPIKRVISQYGQEVKAGHRMPKLAEILRDDKDGHLMRYLRTSRYATHLSRYLRWFPPEQFLVMEYSSFYDDTEAGYARVRRFLGLPERDMRYFSFCRVNEARKPVWRSLSALLRGSSRKGLGKLIPYVLRDRIKSIRNKVELANTVKLDSEDINPEIEAQIATRLLGEIEQLEALFDANPEMLQGGNFDTKHWIGRDFFRTAQLIK